MAPILSTSPPSSLDALPPLCKEIEPFFLLSPDRLVSILHEFKEEFNQGLSEYGKDMAMVPSFVTGVPDGSERGTFLALDLGGTNL